MPGSHIAILVKAISGGGLEGVVRTLARGFVARGHRVDLVTAAASADAENFIPDGVRLVRLKPSTRIAAHAALMRRAPVSRIPLLRMLGARKPHRFFRYYPAVVEYLSTNQPDTCLAAYTPVNLVALWAREASTWNGRVVISERNALSAKIQTTKKPSARRWPALVRESYPLADDIVSVCRWVSDDLVIQSGLAPTAVSTIYNPVLRPELLAMADEAAPHPFIDDSKTPLILGIGRLSSVKDFSTLMRGFHRLRARRPARLAILGEGSKRQDLMDLAEELGVLSDLALPGWVDNPYPWMKRANVIALTSRHEGLPNVLCEALALGRAVVSTDCPGGVREILADGTYGSVIRVGDDEALAAALESALADPPASDHQRRGAERFEEQNVVSRFVDVVLGGGGGGGATA